MPLIRYKNGDMGIPGTHFEDAILPLSSMASVSGRTSDIIELPKGGRLVVPSFFGSVLLKEINSIRQYQIEKVASDKLIIKLVVKEQLSKKDDLTLKNALDEYLAGQISYEIKVVDYIAVSPNGKFKLLVDKTKS
jgi:phenylacetate-CoA ligase